MRVQRPSHAMATSKPYRVLTVSGPIEVLRGVEPGHHTYGNSLVASDNIATRLGFQICRVRRRL